MTYEPFALKYRPRTFSDVVGQEAVAATLQNAVRNRRVANAFLFCGSRGVGKTSMARIFAKALNCADTKDGEPCGTCEVCVSISQGEDIDVIEVDGASNRGIEEIRTIRDNVGYTPSRSSHKVYIIDEVHMLTVPAFNALLKTLEEPPSHVRFVFATTEAHAVPETIISRCQRHEFRRISKEDIQRRLADICVKEGVQVEEGLLEEIARRGEGGLRDALGLLDQLVSFAGQEPAMGDLDRVLGRIDSQILEAILRPAGLGETGPLLDGLDAAFELGRDAEEILSQTTELLREAMVREARGLPGGGEGRRASLVELVREHFPMDRLLLALRLCLNTRREVKIAGQARLQLELAMLKIARSRELIAIPEILSRLAQGEALEGAPAAVPERGPPAASSPTRGPSRPRSVPPAPPRDKPEAETEAEVAKPAPKRPSAEKAVPVASDAGPPPLDIVRAKWPRVVEGVKTKKPRAASLVEQAVPEEVKGGSLVLRLPAGWDFQRRQLEGKLRSLIEDEIESAVGHRFRIDCTVPTMDESRSRPAARQAMDDPGVRRLCDSFGGDVIAIDGPLSESEDTHHEGS